MIDSLKIMVRLMMNCFLCLIAISLIQCSARLSADRSFTIDYENNQFLKDGKPFRYASGSLHYFRVPSVLWRDRMIKYRAAGLNAIHTYIEWSFHEPEKGVYNFSGDSDLIGFLETAQEVGLVVVLRAGPFIAAERDMGGFPYWLLTINPKMNLRSSDPTYISEVDRWYSYLLPMLVPMLYKNGGPVIAVQIENEYGAYGCDFEYNAHLRDLFHQFLGVDTVLFTNNDGEDVYLECGKVDNVFTTIDLGPDADPIASFAAQHRHQEFGPNVDSEFYPGWLDIWEEPHSQTSTSVACNALDKILALNASVNVYMFHGGTSFGFGSGAYIFDTYQPCPTSYDYDAPLNEAGDPTPKYYAMRNVIGKYLPLPNIPVPVPSPKMELPPIVMNPVSSLFDYNYLEDPIPSQFPLTFEQLKQGNGFVLYSTNISVHPSDPAVLQITGLADRAQVFVDSEYSGTLSRMHKLYQIPIDIQMGSKLDILVENQGRVAFGSNGAESKGITSNVTLGPITLTKWNHYRVFPDWNRVVFDIQKQLSKVENMELMKRKSNIKSSVPSFFAGQFTLPNIAGYPFDTFLRLDGWKKGIAFLNGFNLGRYWPIAGPQITLYSPAHLFKPYPQINYLVVFEQEGSPCLKSDECVLQFVKTHVINGTTPYSQFLKPKNIPFSKTYIRN